MTSLKIGPPLSTVEIGLPSSAPIISTQGNWGRSGLNGTRKRALTPYHLGGTE